MAESVHAAARSVLCESGIEAKLLGVENLVSLWSAGSLGCDDEELTDVTVPGRPDRPELLRARDLPRRSFQTFEGRLHLIHAVAHIEFNAINLALDAVFRFRGLPSEFYGDWIGVAQDEARHFVLLQDRLQDLGHTYGDFPAHNGLWEYALETAHDPLVRMAVVPRVLEARGLDVTPGMIARLEQARDLETVAILKVIHREEIGHVECGTRWFRHICLSRGLDAETTYFEVLSGDMSRRIIFPLDVEARAQAGFTRRELSRLEEICRANRKKIE